MASARFRPARSAPARRCRSRRPAPGRLAGAALALALPFASAACSSDDGDAPAGDRSPSAVAPGDPRFVRDPALDVELVSQRGGSSSHEGGKNCMQCHQRLGPGPGLFTVAGTVYDADGAPRADATLTLSDAGGGVVLRVDADARGNFYSTAPLPEVELFPSLAGADGREANAMPFGTLSAACNVCHGTVDPITLRPVE